MFKFDRSEFTTRIRKTKARMEAAGIDVLCVVNPGNMYYLTGYLGESAYVPQTVILALTEDEPWIILRMQDTHSAATTVFMAPERIIGYSESYIGDLDKNGFDFFAERIEEWGFGSARIGIEEADRFFTANAWKGLLRGLPNARFKDATAVATGARLVKSAAELALMQQAAAISDKAIETAYNVIRPGVRECDAAAEIYGALLRGAGNYGGDLADSPAVSMPSGINTGASHLNWTDQPYPANTPINIELAGCRHRYAAPIARSLHLGKAPEMMLTLHKATRNGIEAVLDVLKPGMLCQDAAFIFQREIGKFGFEKKSRVGYALGIDWLEPSASLKEGDMTVLEPNMTFHLLGGMWENGYGCVLSEPIRITENGVASFCTISRDLFVRG